MAHRTDDELRKASASLHYEFDMLRQTASRLDSILRGRKADRVEQNAFVESFLVHARNLIVFLEFRKPTHSEDVRARHFVTGWAPQVPSEDWVEEVYGEVSARVAHLSYQRLTLAEDKQWPIRAIVETLEREVLRLVNLIPRNLKAPSWDAPLGPVFSPHSSDQPHGYTGAAKP